MKRSGLFGHSSGGSVSLTASAFSTNPSLAPQLVAPSSPALFPRIDPRFVDVRSPADPQSDPSWPVIRGVFALSVAAVAMPSATPPNVRSPVFILLGRRDSIVQPPLQENIFNGLSARPKRVFAVMRGGNHCFLDPLERYPYPASDCDWSLELQGQLLSPAAQSWVSRRSAVAFFRAALYGDASPAGAGYAWGKELRNDPLMDVRCANRRAFLEP